MECMAFQKHYDNFVFIDHFLEEILDSLLKTLWHVCARQKLWSQQRQPLLGNRFANAPIARQQLHNTQQWSNWEAVFSTRSVPIATWCNNRRTVGRVVFCAVSAGATEGVYCTCLGEKYKRLKLGGGEAYDRSSDLTAVVARATNNRTWSAVLNLDWPRPCIYWIYIYTTYIHSLNNMWNVNCTYWQQTCYCWLWLWQMTDPSSRQRERPTSTSVQSSDSNKDWS
jgi:hypothetical protein